MTLSGEIAWATAAILVAVHLASCVLVARRAARMGMNPVRWLGISFMLTAFAAGRRLKNRLAARRGDDVGGLSRTPDALEGSPATGPVDRCPRCFRLISPAEAGAGEPKACPRCGAVLERTHLA